jgi:ferric-dicitrate binding protein FerR (iron transport regulator)
MKEQDEDQIAALLRLAGPRPRVSDERAARVRAAVHDEWRRGVRKRSSVRWLLAAAAAAVIAVVMVLPREHPVPAPTTPWIETHANTLSLDWNGATLRVDKETRVRLDSSRVATLDRGAVYFDGTHRGIAIKTPFGEIRDIGTQFEARLRDGSLRVRVREGSIDLRGNIATAGMELVANGQTVTKNAIAVSGAEWKWIEDAAPPLRLEGLTLREAVTRVAREKGLRVELQGVDGNARLHGSVEFTPDEALDAATAATSASYQINNGTLFVRRR